MMMMPAKYITELYLVFPPYGNALSDVEFFEQLYSSVDTCSVARLGHCFVQISHADTFVRRECLKHGSAWSGHAVAIAFED